VISNHIVVGVDGSTGARSALRFAADECRIRRSTLVVVHTPDPDDLMLLAGSRQSRRPTLDELGERVLREHAVAASARQPGVPVTTRLARTPAADALIELSSRADLVVVGNRGRIDIASSILGSVSHRVAAHALCPVAVVPEQPAFTARTLAPHLVVGLAPSRSGRLALEFALEEARLRGAAFIGVRAEDSFAGAEPQSTAALNDQVEAAAAGYPDVIIKRTRVDSEPVAALLGAARSAQLVVIGGHHSDDRWSTRLGRVPSAIAHRAPCPVVIVGQRRHATRDRDEMFVADFA
jgi:nucleotide-binding universal stress UspA family protein